MKSVDISRDDDSLDDEENGFDEDVEPSGRGTFQIVNGLVSFIRQTSLSGLNRRPFVENLPSATSIDDDVPRTTTDEEEQGEQEDSSVRR